MSPPSQLCRGLALAICVSRAFAEDYKVERTVDLDISGEEVWNRVGGIYDAGLSSIKDIVAR